MLRCEGLIKTFKDKCAVAGLTINVEKGEVFALLGSNGSGKSTSIKMILGLLPKESGTIEIKEGTTIGYSPETPYFPAFLTGREVLYYYAKLQKIEKKQIEKEVEEILRQVGLEDSKGKVCHYSKGMLQRLALGQALLGNPELLILDEPTAGLDAMGRVEMIQLLKKLKSNGKTILMNSHILSDVERVCDRGVIMKNGNQLFNWDKNNDYGGKSLEEIFIETIGGTAP